MTIRNLPKGTKIKPICLEYKVGKRWTGPASETEIDTAVDVEGIEGLIIARFLVGDFKYGAAYKLSSMKYGNPDRDFTELAKLTAILLEYFRLTNGQLKAFFTDSNLPRDAMSSVRTLLES